MNKFAKFQFNFCCSFYRFSRYSLTALMGVVLLSDIVSAKVGGLENYSSEISPEILLDKYQDNLPSLETGDKQVLLQNYQNQQQIYLAQQPAPTPSIPLNPEQQKLYQQGVKLVQEGQELEKKGTKEASEQAINKYQQALKIAQELELRKEEVEILAYIANVYSSINDNKNAIEYLKQAVNISRELKQPVWEATALGSIGIMYTNSNNPKEGLKYLQEVQTIFLAQKEYSSLAITLNGIATIHMRIGDTKKALDYRNQALKIYREQLHDLAGEAHTLSTIATIYSLSGEPRRAIDYYEQSLKIQRQRNDFPAQVKIISDVAAIQDKLGNTKNALESLKEALKLQQQANFNLSDQANTIAHIGHIYAGQADYRTAIDYYEQAGKLFQQAGDTPMLSRTFVMIANAHKTFSGDYQKALEFLNKALELQVDDKDDQAFTLGQKADIYLSQANYQLALDEYNKALELQRSIPNPRSEARILRNIALVYRHLGDYKSSIDTYNKALDIYKRILHKSEEIETLASIATVYEWQDKSDEALQFYKQALSLLSKDNYQSEIRLLWGMTTTYKSLNNYPKALESANRALKLSQENSFYEEFSLYAVATVYRAKGEYQKSLDISNQLLAYYRKARLRIREAQMLGDMSITYERLNKYQQAIDTLNQELKLRRELKDSKAEANAFYNIAINQSRLGKLEAALSNIQAAINIVENIRGNVQSDELRTSYFATVQNYYKFYIDLLMQLHEKDPTKVCEFNIQDLKIKDRCDAVALHISERARARSLVELLEQARVNIREGINPQLLIEESRLRSQIDVQEKRRLELASKEETKAQADRLNKEIENLLSQYRDLQTKISTSNPKYKALKYPTPLTFDQIQQQLDKDTILLQYSLGKERSYLWVVTPDSLQSYELAKEEEIETVANELRTLLGAKRMSGMPIEPTVEATSKLSQLILEPVAQQLGQKRLVIVADGTLQYIPFAALTDPNKLAKASDYQPLIVNHEIVNLPSASTIAIQRQELEGRKPAAKTLAILANPVFSKKELTELPNKTPSDLEHNLEQSELKRATRDLDLNDLIPLPNTQEEANGIIALVPKEEERLSAFGTDANYAWVTSPKLSNYRYLHFATHGFLNSTNPELSGIVLSLVDKKGNPQKKGFLRLNELFNLKFPAELVVLSACQTGLGKEVKGEGLIGLTRGLMYAGAERVTVSLWSVNDEATSVLMQEFYTQMLKDKDGKSPVAALRAAQKKIWEKDQWRDPHYWSAFTIQGEWRN